MNNRNLEEKILSKRNLAEIAFDSVGIGMCWIPLYSAFNTFFTPDTFAETMKDPKTHLIAVGLTVGNMLYELSKQAYKSWKNKRGE